MGIVKAACPSIGDVVAEKDRELPLVGQVQGNKVQESSRKRKAQEADLVAEIRELKKVFKANTAMN